MSENRVMRRILGFKRHEKTRECRSYIMRSFKICTPHLILFGSSKQK